MVPFVSCTIDARDFAVVNMTTFRDVAPDRMRVSHSSVEGEAVAIACSHQDQVVEAPGDALTILSSEFTPHAGLLYANGATLTVQPHPEFETGFAHLCCDIRKGLAPDELVAEAKASLAEPVDNARLGGAIARFLTRGQRP